MSKLIGFRMGRVLVALIIVAGAMVMASTEKYVPVAHANNYCSTPALAGKFINNSGSNVLVKGNKATDNNDYIVTVAPGKKASDYGICDADFYKPSVNYIVEVSMSVIYTYNAYDAWTKIPGSGTSYCSPDNYQFYKAKYPISCSVGNRYPA